MKTIKPPLISQLTLFYSVVQLGSFSRAAEQLAYSKSYVSQQIKALEQQTGLQLIERNTRNMSLTLAGEQLFAHSKKLVAELENASATLANLRAKPAGRLRITAPRAYSEYRLSPLLPQFLEAHPDVHIELITTDATLDLIQDKIDIAIRLSHTPPEDRIAKRLSNYGFQLCAAPSYLNQHGEPAKPSELSQHKALVYNLGPSSRRWTFDVDGTETTIEVPVTLASDNSAVLLESALAGQGIVKLPDYVVANAIKEGKLKCVLSAFYPSKIPIYLIYAKKAKAFPSIQAFIEFIQSHLK